MTYDEIKRLQRWCENFENHVQVSTIDTSFKEIRKAIKDMHTYNAFSGTELKTQSVRFRDGVEDIVKKIDEAWGAFKAFTEIFGEDGPVHKMLLDQTSGLTLGE